MIRDAPAARQIPTAKIPECQPHIERGLHTKLYRFSPSDYMELAAVFNGPHPETGEELTVDDTMPEGAPWNDLPPQPAVFAPDYAPEDIAEIAARLRARAELPRQPTGTVASTNGAPPKARAKTKTKKPAAKKAARK